MSHNSVLYVPFAVFMCVNHLTCVYYLRGKRIKEIAFCEQTWCMMYDWICSNEGLALQMSLSESPSRWKISFIEWTNFIYRFLHVCLDCHKRCLYWVSRRSSPRSHYSPSPPMKLMTSQSLPPSSASSVMIMSHRIDLAGLGHRKNSLTLHCFLT